MGCGVVGGACGDFEEVLVCHDWRFRWFGRLVDYGAIMVALTLSLKPENDNYYIEGSRKGQFWGALT